MAREHSQTKKSSPRSGRNRTATGRGTSVRRSSSDRLTPRQSSSGLKTVRVALKEASYNIFIGHRASDKLAHLISEHELKGTAIIVSQKEIWKCHGKKMIEQLAASGIHAKPFIAPATQKSEQMKNFGSLKKLLEKTAAWESKGEGLFFIALGGGVVGDLAGFAASVYKRGVPLIQIPTTVTAQVDSAIGGKNAIDLPCGKNLIGTIYQPKFVLIDTSLLDTLPRAFLSDGMAEVIKYAMIKDARLFTYLERNSKKIMNRDPEALEKIITQSCKIKAQVVSKDPMDTKDIRAVLNFGHTVGHAIEAAGGYQGYSHGQAVAVGMIAAAELSLDTSTLTNRAVVGKLRRLLSLYDLPQTIQGVRVNSILKALLYDKKRINGKNRFVLISDIGRTQLFTDVPSEAIKNRIEGLRSSKKKKQGFGILDMLFSGSAQPGKAEAVVVSKPHDEDHHIGIVRAYFSKIKVAIVQINGGEVRQGDRITFKGRKTNFHTTIRSIQINHKPVTEAKKGDTIGLTVPKPVKQGDRVYL